MNAKAVIEIVHLVGISIVWTIVGLAAARVVVAFISMAESLESIAKSLNKTEYSASQISEGISRSLMDSADMLSRNLGSTLSKKTA